MIDNEFVHATVNDFWFWMFVGYVVGRAIGDIIRWPFS